MSVCKPGDLCEVTVEKLVPGGAGKAIYQGLVVFVSKAAPGDRLLVEISEVKKSFARARIRQILNPSPDRVTAPCPVFEACGGCDWQHLAESAQARLKQSILKELFPHLTLEPLRVPSQKLRYRSRIDLHKVGDQVGYFAERSHSLVAIQDCLLLENSLVPRIQELRDSPVTDGRYRIAPSLGQGFTQVNPEVNQLIQTQLVQRLRQFPSLQGFSWVELYAGSGNFAFHIFENFPMLKIHAFEADADAVAAGLERARKNNWSSNKVQLLRASSELVAQRFRPPQPGLLFVDPPREGLSQTVSEWLNRQKAERFFYLSCDPVTLKRDLERLPNWTPLSLQGYDMFPQTHHLEVLVELQMKSNIS